MELLNLPFKSDMAVNLFLQVALFYDTEGFIQECKGMEFPSDLIQNLNDITYGQRIDLSEINAENFIMLPCFVLYPNKHIDTEPIGKVIRFSFMVAEELARLNERDEKNLSYNFDKNELKAGAKKMNHGLFGIIDNIARRCPQYSHEDILNLSQQKVYMMLKIDVDNANYGKRLHEIYSEAK